MGILLSEKYFPKMQEVDGYLPFVGVKFKDDRMTIGGKSVPYDNATLFVQRDGEYIPCMCISDVKEGERIFDLYAFLNIGLTEVLLTLEMNRTRFLRSLLALFTSERLFDSIEGSIDFLNDRNSFYDALEWSIRSGQIRSDFCSIKKIVTLMNIARKTNQKFYFEQLFDLMKIAYSCCLPWVDKSFEKIDMFGQYDPKSLPKELFGNWNVNVNGYPEGFKPLSRHDILPSTLKTGAISYETNRGQIRKVTDGRGLSVYLFLSFLYHVYASFADFAKEKIDYGICREGSLSMINENIESCLGNDEVGKWVKTGRLPLEKVTDEAKEISALTRTTIFDSHKTLEDKFGNTTTKAMVDSFEMFKRASGFDMVEQNSLCYNDCYYSNFDDVCNMAIYSILVMEEYPILSSDTYESRFKQVENKAYMDMVQKLLENNDSSNNEELLEVKSRLSQSEKEYESLKKENDLAKAKIADLERQLLNQRRIAEDQREEIERLKALSDCIYSEEDIGECGEGENASICDMVSYLNEFKTTIVGGHFDTERRLTEMGLTNVVYISSETEASGNGWETDFIVICATFVSHKMVYAVESQFDNKRGETMYFNGTNAEKLVRAMYSFVKKWMGEE